MVENLFYSGASLDKESLFDLIRMYSSEIEYSEDNIDSLVFDFECEL